MAESSSLGIELIGFENIDEFDRGSIQEESRAFFKKANALFPNTRVLVHFKKHHTNPKDRAKYEFIVKAETLKKTFAATTIDFNMLTAAQQTFEKAERLLVEHKRKFLKNVRK